MDKIVTVQDLIDALSKIPDKTKTAFVYMDGERYGVLSVDDDVEKLVDISIDNPEKEFSAFGFNADDVLTRAEDMGYELTAEDARPILERILSKGDMSSGISWYTLEFFIDEYCEEHGKVKTEDDED